MDGIHDMGGMDGFGPVDPSAAQPYHAEWEGRVFGLTLATSAHLRSNLDRTRFELERLSPADYLRGYFERWHLRMLNNAEEAGIIDGETRAAIERGERVSSDKTHQPLPVDVLLSAVASGRSTLRESVAKPIFRVGDTVRARNMHPKTHTRLPRYTRGKTGVVVALRGVHVYPDASARLAGEDPCHLYAVRFGADELWGEGGSQAGSVTLDLFEPYLEAGG